MCVCGEGRGVVSLVVDQGHMAKGGPFLMNKKNVLYIIITVEQ